MQSFHSKSSQQNEMKSKFLNQPITIGKKEVKSGWLADIDKLTYPTYLLNAFYLLEIRNFLGIGY